MEHDHEPEPHNDEDARSSRDMSVMPSLVEVSLAAKLPQYQSLESKFQVAFATCAPNAPRHSIFRTPSQKSKVNEHAAKLKEQIQVCTRTLSKCRKHKEDLLEFARAYLSTSNRLHSSGFTSVLRVTIQERLIATRLLSQLAANLILLFQYQEECCWEAAEGNFSRVTGPLPKGLFTTLGMVDTDRSVLNDILRQVRVHEKCLVVAETNLKHPLQAFFPQPNTANHWYLCNEEFSLCWAVETGQKRVIVQGLDEFGSSDEEQSKHPSNCCFEYLFNSLHTKLETWLLGTFGPHAGTSTYSEFVRSCSEWIKGGDQLFCNHCCAAALSTSHKKVRITLEILLQNILCHPVAIDSNVKPHDLHLIAIVTESVLFSVVDKLTQNNILKNAFAISSHKLLPQLCKCGEPLGGKTKGESSWALADHVFRENVCRLNLKLRREPTAIVQLFELPEELAERGVVDVDTLKTTFSSAFDKLTELELYTVPREALWSIRECCACIFDVIARPSPSQKSMASGADHLLPILSAVVALSDISFPHWLVMNARTAIESNSFLVGINEMVPELVYYLTSFESAVRFVWELQPEMLE